MHSLTFDHIEFILLICTIFWSAEHILKLLDLTFEICINRIKKHFNENKK